MPLDDREHNFENALRRHLRAACPDAETLAAYHEDGLAAEEMARCKKHISACAACREILGQLEVTEKVGQAGEHEIATLAGQRERAAQQAKFGESRVREMPRRGLWLRWAAPAGAIAAGLLVWVAVQEMKQPALVPQRPAQVAEERAPAPPSTVAESRQPKPAAKVATPAEKLESAAREAKSAAEAGKTNEGIGRLDSPARTRSVQPPDKPAAEGDKAQIAATLANAAPKERALRSDALAVAGNEPAPPGVQSQVVAGQAARPVPAPAREESALDEGKGAIAKGVLSAAATAEITSNYQQQDSLRARQIAAANPILSPGGKTQWRVGENGAIERSKDNGLRWEAQSSGVTVALTAGSAPTEKVCWVVGKAGTILRTVDGGKYWEKILSPISSDLGAVQADDALRARIWDATRELSYETSDGGATWNKVGGR